MTVLTPLTEKDYDGLKRILRSLQVCYTIINIFIMFLVYFNLAINSLFDKFPTIKVIMCVYFIVVQRTS